MGGHIESEAIESTGTSVGAAAAQQVSLDCDSDELEALEDAADVESADDEELDRIVSQAEARFPPQRVAQLMHVLKQDGLARFMQAHISTMSRHDVLALMVALGVLLPRRLRDSDDIPTSYYIALLKTTLVRQLRRREKLPEYNTVDDVVELLRNAKRIIVLGGAGMSTSCGIPDFRSKDGIYAQLQRDTRYASELADPHDMFDKQFFLHDPRLFFTFARSIFPSNFVPSPSHRFVKLLEQRDVLLRNYTQNIDTLEQAAGIERVLHCHGSFARAACTTPACAYEVAGSAIKDDIFAQRVPRCPRCRDAESEKRAAIQAKAAKRGKKAGWHDSEDDDEADDEDQLPGLGVVKPCITFFGEKLSDDFDRCLVADREEVDLLLVIGTSLKVAPVSELVGHIPHGTPVVLINRTPVLHMAMDVQLLGNADAIVEYLCRRLEWQLPLPQPAPDVVGEQSAAQKVALQGDDEADPASEKEQKPQRLGDSHIWLFPGAEADELIEMWGQDRAEEDEDAAADEDTDEHQESDGDAAQQEGGRLEGDDIVQSPRKRAADDTIDAPHSDTKHKQARLNT